MNAIELALEKQRLQLQSASQRMALADYAQGLQPLFAAADRAREGGRWVQRHPEVAVGVVAAVAVTSPRARRSLWHWTRRGFVVWRLWRDSRRWLGQDSPPSHAS